MRAAGPATPTSTSLWPATRYRDGAGGGRDGGRANLLQFATSTRTQPAVAIHIDWGDGTPRICRTRTGRIWTWPIPTRFKPTPGTRRNGLHGYRHGDRLLGTRARDPGPSRLSTRARRDCIAGQRSGRVLGQVTLATFTDASVGPWHVRLTAARLAERRGCRGTGPDPGAVRHHVRQPHLHCFGWGCGGLITTVTVR